MEIYIVGGHGHMDGTIQKQQETIPNIVNLHFKTRDSVQNRTSADYISNFRQTHDLF